MSASDGSWPSWSRSSRWPAAPRRRRTGTGIWGPRESVLLLAEEQDWQGLKHTADLLRLDSAEAERRWDEGNERLVELLSGVLKADASADYAYVAAPLMEQPETGAPAEAV